MVGRNILLGGILATLTVILTACTTNSEGVSELFGIIPLDESTVDTVETVATEAKSSGGILGIIGTVVGGGIALWRRKKELAEKSNAEKATEVAKSVVSGVSSILDKVSEVHDGGSWTPTKEELIALLVAAQEAAGTRSEVDKILSEQAA